MKRCLFVVKLNIFFQVDEKLRKRTLNDMERVAHDCFDYMSTDFGRDTILNPQNIFPSVDVPSYSTFVEQLHYMVRQHVERFLKSKEVLQKFRDVRHEIFSFYHKLSLDLSKMENEWIYDQSRPGSVVCIYENLVTSPFWFPEFTMDISTVILNQELNSKIKHQAKDDCYSNIIMLIPTAVFDHLKSSYGIIIFDLLDKVTENLLPKRINQLKMMISQNRDFPNDISDNKRIDILSRKIKTMELYATELKDSLENQLHPKSIPTYSGVL